MTGSEKPGSGSRRAGQDSLGRIGIVGLGNAGMEFARNLLPASDVLTAHDLRSEAVDRLAVRGAVVGGNCRDVAAGSDIVVLSLPDTGAVFDAMQGERGILSAGRSGILVIDISTIDPAASRQIQAEAAGMGVGYLDAPMSGGEPGGAGQAGARNGTVTFMVGGERDEFERAWPVFDLLGRHAFFMGPAGSGNTAKLVSNLIAGLNMAVLAEGFILGAAAGIPPETLLEVFRHTDARSFTMFEEFAPQFAGNGYEGGFPASLMYKDHRLARDLARRHGVPLPFNRLALEAYENCLQRGLGRKSHAVVIEAAAASAGVELRNTGGGSR